MALPSNLEYRIATNNELATVLSRFNTNFILEIISDNLKRKYQPYNPFTPNTVEALEQRFKLTIQEYPDAADEIGGVRIQTYKDIINIICSHYNLKFLDSDSIDYYSAAYYIYELLVSGFFQNVVQFYCEYIIKEKSAIYDLLNLSLQKRNKDSSTLYGKKVFKNQKIATIYANINDVIYNMQGFDIAFDAVLNKIYIGDRKPMIPYIESLVVPGNDFYKDVIIPYVFNDEIHSIILTNIRIGLQQMAGDYDNIQIYKSEGE